MKPIPSPSIFGPARSTPTHWVGGDVCLCLLYFERRLRRNGYQTTGWSRSSCGLSSPPLSVAASCMWSRCSATYSDHPGQILAIWQGGLSSFGGLLFAYRPASSDEKAAVRTPIVAPRLGRPVLMGRGRWGDLDPTHGRLAAVTRPTSVRHVYANQAGRRLPVPIFQALEDFSVYLILIAIEHALKPLPNGAPSRLPLGHGARGRDGALGYRAFPRRAPVARRGRAPRITLGAVGGHRPGYGGTFILWQTGALERVAVGALGPRCLDSAAPQATSASGLKRPDRARWCLAFACR